MLRGIEPVMGLWPKVYISMYIDCRNNNNNNKSVNLGNKECRLGSSYNGSHLGSAFDLDPNWTTFLDENYTGTQYV